MWTLSFAYRFQSIYCCKANTALKGDFWLENNHVGYTAEKSAVAHEDKSQSVILGCCCAPLLCSFFLLQLSHLNKRFSVLIRISVWLKTWDNNPRIPLSRKEKSMSDGHTSAVVTNPSVTVNYTCLIYSKIHIFSYQKLYCQRQARYGLSATEASGSFVDIPTILQYSLGIWCF